MDRLGARKVAGSEPSHHDVYMMYMTGVHADSNRLQPNEVCWRVLSISEGIHMRQHVHITFDSTAQSQRTYHMRSAKSVGPWRVL